MLSNMWTSQAYLLPAPLHKRVNGVRGQAWLQEAVACVQGFHHLRIGAVVIRKAALTVHLPHEHTCGRARSLQRDLRESWHWVCKFLACLCREQKKYKVYHLSNNPHWHCCVATARWRPTAALSSYTTCLFLTRRSLSLHYPDKY